MIFYDKDGIVIRLVEEKDINNIIDLFSKNNFNCDFESGSLKPSNNQLESIIRDSVNNENRINVVILQEKEDPLNINLTTILYANKKKIY